MLCRHPSARWSLLHCEIVQEAGQLPVHGFFPIVTLETSATGFWRIVFMTLCSVTKSERPLWVAKTLSRGNLGRAERCALVRTVSRFSAAQCLKSNPLRKNPDHFVLDLPPVD